MSHFKSLLLKPAGGIYTAPGGDFKRRKKP